MNEQIDIYRDSVFMMGGPSDVRYIRITYADQRTRVMTQTLAQAQAYVDGFNRALQMLELPQIPVYEHDNSFKEHELRMTCYACEYRKNFSEKDASR